MDREALALVGRLEARLGQEPVGGDGKSAALPPSPVESGADGSGRANPAAEVEMLGEMSRTTLALVGTAAYG